MVKCSLCGKEFDGGRAMHGHLMSAHREEYQQAGYKQEIFITAKTQQKDIKAQRKKIDPDRPAGFRLLNKNNRDELAAYNEGYRYIDNEDIVYDRDEAEAEGWV